MNAKKWIIGLEEIRVTNKKALTFVRAFCGTEWARTTDSRIFSPMLYQLSYSTVWRGAKLCKI